MNERDKTDLRIVDTILAAIEEGKHRELQKWKTDFIALKNRLETGNFTAITPALKGVLEQDRELFLGAILITAEKALQFVQDQIDHYATIRDQRPLTDEEKRVGSDCLLPMLASLRELVQRLH